MYKLIIFGYDCSSKFSTQLFKYYLSNDWKFHTKSNSSKLIKNISQECDRVSDGIVRQILLINARVITALFIIIGLVIYNYILALLSFIIFFTSYYLIYSVAKKKLKLHGENITKRQTIRYNILSDSFGNIRDIILYNIVDIKTKTFKEHSDNLARSRGISAVITIVPKNFIEFIAFSLVVILTISLYSFYQGDLSAVLSLVAIFGLSSMKILPAFQSVYLCISILKNNISALDEIKDDLYNLKIYEKKNIISQTLNNNLLFNNDITLNNVYFSYNNQYSIFENLNIKISKKNKIGIIGETGVGKSTFLNIICGLILTEKGNISIDGVILNEKNLKKWQEKISLAEQNVFISDNSLLENILAGNINTPVDFPKINKVIKLAELDDFIASLEKGIHTNLGEKGVLISAGQKQRIGIARALYRNPELLILDEATNALDFVTEEKVYKNIFSEYKDKNLIIISHRKHSLKLCDKIYSIEDKKFKLMSKKDIL